MVLGTAAGAVAQGQAVVVAYTDPTNTNDFSAIQDAAGNDAASFTTGEDGVPAVVNNSTVAPPDTTSPTLVSAEVSLAGTDVVLTFSEDVTSPATDGIIDTVGRFGLTVDGVAVRGDDFLIDDYTGPRMALSVAPSSAFNHGETVVVTYTDQTAGDDSNVIEDAAGNEVATFTTGVGGVPAVVNNSRVGASSDTTSPTLSSASVNAAGSEITLTFNENIYGIKVAGVGDFSVTAGGDAVSLTTASASLPLSMVLGAAAGAIEQGETVVVTYTDPTASNDEDALQDPAGNDVATFTTGSGTVPAVVNNSTVVRAGHHAPDAQHRHRERGWREPHPRFDEDLGSASLATDQFSVTADGVAVTPYRFRDSSFGRQLVRLLFSAGTFQQGETVVVTYTDPTVGNDANAIQDTAGNDVASFTTGWAACRRWSTTRLCRTLERRGSPPPR